MVKIRSAVPDDAKRLLEIYAYYVLHTVITCEYTVIMLLIRPSPLNMTFPQRKNFEAASGIPFKSIPIWFWKRMASSRAIPMPDYSK